MQHSTTHHWRTSSYSNDIGQCVEVALTSEAVGIRDTKDRAGGTLAVRPESWAGFVDRLKTGEYDRG
ncbi:hypothetical protein FHR84_003708 [Actinopolyspora biskrensis]|uniref:DUF397 domain-containing protein n=1 Tax=Actinopolyspora biskrensis TaxID=1470178 RepID=A0A852Z0K6_9ACTN|nr:DUF397 domain-containing protein [Actinopolyspora biskrensis]NYH80351.1 hypothetical protein [Actinopolyspora biskrensis]